MSQADGDFRVRLGFFRNIKTRRLQAELGPQGVVSLLTLWGYTAENHASGKLGKIDATQVEIMAEWTGDRGAFFDAMTSMRWIDVSSAGVVSLHDWEEHQQWIVNRPVRQRASRLANKSRWDKELARLRAGSETESGADPKRSPDRSGAESGSTESGVLPSLPFPSPPSPSEDSPLPPKGGGDSASQPEAKANGQHPKTPPNQRSQRRERPDPADPAEALARDMVRQINGGRTLCRDVATGLLAKGVPVETVRAFLEDASPDMTPNAFQEWVVKEYLAPGLAVESQAPRCAECGCESSGPSAIRLVVVDGVTKCDSCAAGKAEPCPECGALWPADERVARQMNESASGPREVVCCAKCGGWSVKRMGVPSE